MPAAQERQQVEARKQEERVAHYKEFLADVDRGQPVLVWPRGMYVEDVLSGKECVGRQQYDELVATCRQKADYVNNRLMREECCVMAALLDERGLMIGDGARVC